ncbi:MAG: VWA domain-containing protein, partial [Candidatus Buchananbacteria bacterium]
MKMKSLKISWKILNVLVAAFLILPTNLGSMLVAPSANAVEPTALCQTNVDVVLIIDRSGSMADGGSQSSCRYYTLVWGIFHSWRTTHNVTQSWCDAKSLPGYPSTYTPATPNKIEAAKAAANTFLGLVGLADQSGLVSFSTAATLDKGLSGDHAATQAAVNALVANGATNIGDAIDLANQELGSTRAQAQSAKVAILLTDGMANKPNGNGSGENAADVAYAKTKASEAAGLGYKIFTIGLGSDINESMLQEIATATGASYFNAPNQSDLNSIYNTISQRICQFGSISGCKFQDANHDGDISNDQKISGWPIILSGAKNETQLTDQSGCYQFSGLLPGNYTVSEGSLENQSFFQTYPLDNSYVVALADGQNVTNQDFGNYLPICGNQILDSDFGEVCEIGSTEACEIDGYAGQKTCLADCSGYSECISQQTCGDGVKNGNEQCDGQDGILPNYICTQTCVLEYVPFCGDGEINQTSEQCDTDQSKECVTETGYSGSQTCSQCQWQGCE